ncbi:stage IV sporulation intramembrane metalloprotease SpoIVFB [Bacillaceae bacterium]
MNSLRIAGIALRIHPLFWFVAAGAVLTGRFLEIITLFTIVVIHELGHVFMARSFSWRVRSIELLPFGGVAKVDESGTSDAWEEIAVALAGPFMNAVMILLALFFWQTGVWEKRWTFFFVQSNLTIAGFNLLPIWPLDGGKILQAGASFLLPYRSSLRLTFFAGLLQAIVLLAVACLGERPHLNLLAISLFLLFANGLGYRRLHYQFLRFLLYKHRMLAERKGQWPLVRVVVPATITVADALKKLRRGHYHQFCLIDERAPGLRGGISEEKLLAVFFDLKRPHSSLSEIV